MNKLAPETVENFLFIFSLTNHPSHYQICHSDRGSTEAQYYCVKISRDQEIFQHTPSSFIL